MIFPEISGNETVPDEGVVQQILKHFEADKKSGLRDPRILNPATNEIYAYIKAILLRNLYRLHDAEYIAAWKMYASLLVPGFLVGEEKDIFHQGRKEEIWHARLVGCMIQILERHISASDLKKSGERYVEYVKEREANYPFVLANKRESEQRQLYVRHTHLHRDENLLLRTNNPFEQLLVVFFPELGPYFFKLIREHEPHHLRGGLLVKKRMQLDNPALKEFLFKVNQSPGALIARECSDLGAKIGLIKLGA
jgi:hypothetical protein